MPSEASEPESPPKYVGEFPMDGRSELSGWTGSLCKFLPELDGRNDVFASVM